MCLLKQLSTVLSFMKHAVKTWIIFLVSTCNTVFPWLATFEKISNMFGMKISNRLHFCFSNCCIFSNNSFHTLNGLPNNRIYHLQKMAKNSRTAQKSDWKSKAILSLDPFPTWMWAGLIIVKRTVNLLVMLATMLRLFTDLLVLHTL